MSSTILCTDFYLTFYQRESTFQLIVLPGGKEGMEKLGLTSLPKEVSKFVRDGSVIAFDSPLFSHSEIAKEAALGKGTGGYILGIELMKVDDAGTVDEQSGELCFSSSSSSCELRGDPVLARAQTVEAAIVLTGKPAKAG